MIARALLIAFSTVLALGFAEVAVRSLPPTVLGYEYVNDHFIRPREFERETVLNKLLVHDREPPPRVAGTRRVLLLGDSYVAAISVPIEDGVSRRLEAQLSAIPSVGPIDVVSLAKEGWGQRDELVALRRRGKALRPDLVLLLFTTRNDVYNNATSLPEKIEAQRLLGELRDQDTPVPYLIHADKARGLLFRNSALNRLIAHRLTLPEARAAVPRPAPFEAFAPESQPRWNSAWRETEELLVALRSASDQLGAKFAIAAASTPEGVLTPEEGAERLRGAHAEFANREFDVDLVDRRLLEVCERQKLPCTLLQPELRALQAETGEPLHWPIDGHWNAAGNDAAAKLLAKFAAAQFAAAQPGHAVVRGGN